MNPISRRVETHRNKHQLTHAEASRRARKGWETRRLNNPHLRNIHYVDKGHYEWRRHNEVVPLTGFNHDQVELLAPGLAASDRHLNKQHKVNSHIQGRAMPFHNYVMTPLTGMHMGGYAFNSATYDPKEVSSFEKNYAKLLLHIPKDDWGKRNSVTMNKFDLNHPSQHFHPTSIMTHEMGHLTGPGHSMKFGPSYKHPGVGEKTVKDFEKSFQWEAPRWKKKGKNYHSDRSGKIEMDLVDYAHGSLWKMKGNHPGSLASYDRGPNKGLSSKKTRTYQNHNIYEDFAETYRSMLGVPMSTDPHPPKAVKDWWDWKDKDNSRKQYMEKYHLSKAASRPDQYAKDLADITTKNKRRASAVKARKVKARKTTLRKVQRSVGL